MESVFCFCKPVKSWRECYTEMLRTSKLLQLVSKKVHKINEMLCILSRAETRAAKNGKKVPILDEAYFNTNGMHS